ncbi:MAG: hypothetical protein Kow0074_08320 [Candidatus Zixiibacteriota bacterium]
MIRPFRLIAMTLAVTLVLCCLPHSASARSMEITHFDVQLDVKVDGSIDVTEMIEVEFTGSWQGIYRTVPIEYRSDAGFNYTLFMDVQSVVDGSGSPLKYETSRYGHYKKIKIWVPGAEDARRAVTINYTVDNALRFFEDHDELYWNVTGDEWDFPIQKATATVRLPSGAQQVRAAAYTGIYGSRDSQAGVKIDNNVVSFATTRALSYREGMTVVVGWAKGLVEEPSVADKAAGFIRSNWPLIIPVLVALLMFWIWYKRGRDPRMRPIAVQYEPPDGLSPAEAGTLIDNSADMRDITATIIDLAVRGFLVIEETKSEKLFGLFSSDDYIFHSKKNPAEWSSLKPHEYNLMMGLFKGGSVDRVQMSDLQNKFYTHISTIKSSIFGQLIQKKFYVRRPDNIRGGYIFSGVVIGAILLGFLLVGGYGYGISPVTAIITAFGTALAIGGFGFFMPARTQAGVRALEQVLGFAEFIERVESHKYERIEITPDMFERFLPYAMAFGLEKRWAEAFEGMTTTPPQWYRGTSLSGGFHPHIFAASLSTMTSRASHTMASTPRSKGGSGFSGGGGGGSSGGGFGGGGGGGF